MDERSRPRYVQSRRQRRTKSPDRRTREPSISFGVEKSGTRRRQRDERDNTENKALDNATEKNHRERSKPNETNESGVRNPDTVIVKVVSENSHESHKNGTPIGCPIKDKDHAARRVDSAIPVEENKDSPPHDVRCARPRHPALTGHVGRNESREVARIKPVGTPLELHTRANGRKQNTEIR